MDLKDKLAGDGEVEMGNLAGTERSTRNENADEAVGALVTLGYPAPMAQKAVSAILKADNEVQAVEEMIKRALKML